MPRRASAETEELAEAILRALCRAIEASGMSRQEIARKAGWKESYLARIFLGRVGAVKFSDIDVIASVIGVDAEEIYRAAIASASASINHSPWQVN